MDIKSKISNVYYQLQYWVKHQAGLIPCLNKVATEKKLVESCQQVKTMNWSGMDAISRPDLYPFPQWENLTGNIHSYCLQNVILDAYYMVFFKRKNIITDSNQFITGDLLRSIRVQSEKLISYQDRGVLFCCSDHWENNYYHWMVHAIPSFYAALCTGIKGKFLVPEPLLEWQRRSLELLGIDMNLCVPMNKYKQYALSTVYCFEYATGWADFAISPLSVQAYAHMCHHVFVHVTDELCHDKIYISRANKDNRKLGNEAELIQRLEQRGYFILNPEDYTIDEQIIIFQHAKIVVGLLGAGFSNIAFCKPNTMIYELIPSHHDNPCFLAMSLQGGLRYWADSFQTGVDHHRPDHLSAWENMLDVEVVLKRLDELEKLI